MTRNNIPRIPRDYKNVTPGLYGERRRKALQRKRITGVLLGLLVLTVAVVML